jgi:hypothetical protein
MMEDTTATTEGTDIDNTTNSLAALALLGLAAYGAWTAGHKFGQMIGRRYEKRADKKMQKELAILANIEK